MDFDRPLLLVAHDAGGAELVAAWARLNGLEDCACVAEGPAQRVFAATAVRPMDRDTALARLGEFRMVVTGTSWGSDLEKRFHARAAALGVRSAAYLDHWTDYQERFTSGGRLVLPMEIWVADEHAAALATAAFPGHPVQLAGNWYLEEIVAQVRAREAASAPSARGGRALFVSEPLADAAARKHGDPRYFGYTELEALDAFLAHVQRHWRAELEAIRIRRHPSEPRGKFAAFVSAHAPIAVSECGEAPLAEDCAWADRIVGCQSMAMVVGLLAGKKVFSAIPAGGRPSAIPHSGIVPLFQPRTARPESMQGMTP
jgi:hypothetical protein